MDTGEGPSAAVEPAQFEFYFEDHICAAGFEYAVHQEFIRSAENCVCHGDARLKIEGDRPLRP